MKPIDFDGYALQYSQNRSVQPLVLQHLLVALKPSTSSQILEIGCGSANYLAAIVRETRCTGFGVDPSTGMLERAKAEHPEVPVHLLAGSAESLPIPDCSIDGAFSVDVVHHVQDRMAWASEAFRVVRPGGAMVTVTDSHDDIKGRVPLSSHFPATVEPEIGRYPRIDTLIEELEQAGFADPRRASIVRPYALTDLSPYRERAFSALRIIPDDAVERGLAQLELELAGGSIQAVSRYTVIASTRPH